MEKEKSCCKKKEYKGKSILKGVGYGLIPHIGCIAFIVASILGVTVMMQFFRGFLMNRYFFHILILISLLFATLSSFLYLRKHECLSKEGIKNKKKYLTGMYGSTIGINLVLFMLIFPFLANITGATVVDIDKMSSMKIKVDIPCPGHAPLITNELKTINGVEGSEYSFPNKFDVYYDSSKTTKEEILSLEVFEEYPATILDENIVNSEVKQTSTSNSGSCSGGCGGSGSCGGACGSPTCSYRN